MANKPGSWKRFRKRFISLERYQGEHTCFYCEDIINTDTKPPNYKALTLDHVIPLSKGGGLKDVSNVVVCCYYCNMKKGNKLKVENA